MRTRQIAASERLTPYGFRFGGYDLFHQDDWEAGARELVQSLLPATDVLIDVGASHGYYTCLAAQAGVAVAAIEAEPNSLYVLQKNVLRNGFQGVEIFPIAVAAEVDVRKFYGDGDYASLDPSWTGVGDEFSQLVPTNTLDNLFAGRWLEKQILVKIDVEGLEAEVLAGAQQLMSRARKPYWLIESFPRREDSSTFTRMFEALFAAGYSAILADEGCSAVTLDGVRRWAENPPGRVFPNFFFFDAAVWPRKPAGE